MKPKALMTQYVEGSLASRELRDMMTDYAADARFDRELHDDIDLFSDRQHSADDFGGHDNENDLQKTA